MGRTGKGCAEPGRRGRGSPSQGAMRRPWGWCRCSRSGPWCGPWCGFPEGDRPALQPWPPWRWGGPREAWGRSHFCGCEGAQADVRPWPLSRAVWGVRGAAAWQRPATGEAASHGPSGPLWVCRPAGEGEWRSPQEPAPSLGLVGLAWVCASPSPLTPTPQVWMEGPLDCSQLWAGPETAPPGGQCEKSPGREGVCACACVSRGGPVSPVQPEAPPLALPLPSTARKPPTCSLLSRNGPRGLGGLTVPAGRREGHGLSGLFLCPVPVNRHLKGFLMGNRWGGNAMKTCESSEKAFPSPASRRVTPSTS